MFTRSLDPGAFALPTPWDARPRAVRCPHPYELNVATAYFDRPDILAAWQRMLAGATGPEALYQSPQFFRHLIDMDRGRDASHELFIVRRSTDYTIVGFIPVRTIPCRLPFRAGPVTLFGWTLRACQILGSVPLLDPAETGLAEFITRQLLKRYAACDVLYLQAVPQDALPPIADVPAYVLHGWRACHTQPLPDGVNAYLKHFSAKKRYNLSRQVRLLTEAVGPLRVLRIEDPGQVGAMVDAMVATDASRAAGRGAEQARLESLARHGLLLSYVIRCGEHDVAVVYGMRSATVWHVYRILCRHDYLHLSVGTSAIHLAVQDVLAHFTLDHIDFGYGTPHAEFRSTHVLKTRGHVLLHRARSVTAVLLKVHGMADTLNEALIRRVKRFRK
jgi:CelD/BcsL family acetyltransferase involved in cellulose biosynthesis